MLDLGIWRQSNGIVVRLYGSERLLSEAEFSLFVSNLRKVEEKEADEWMSEGYKEICEDHEARVRNEGQSLLKKLGLERKVDLGELADL